MRTPSDSTFVRQLQEQRERQMQTSFPAKVIDWSQTTNTVKLSPQFLETWIDGNTRWTEEGGSGAYIENVPVLFPRSGSWAITFPIEAGSYGLVTCTKYSLDVWRNQGNATDPGDLRRFTMSGAVFHPVNLYPDSAALSNVNSSYMTLAGSDGEIALADRIDKFFKAFINTPPTPGPAVDNGAALWNAVRAAVTGGGNWVDATHSVKSTKVKAGGKVGV